MKWRWIYTLYFLALAPRLQSAVSLYEADSLWLFDNGTIGQSATHTQIVDATGNGHAANSFTTLPLSWTAGPAAGNYGGSPQAPNGHALKFAPIATISIPGAEAGQIDTVQSAAFTVSNGAVSGNATVVTRMRWDGAIPNFDDGSNQWLLNNGLQSWNPTTLVSGGFLMGLQTDGRLAYYTAGVSGAPQIHTFNTPDQAGAKLQVGQWYDVAMVMDDLGTINDATGRVTFYLVGPDGEFRSFTSASNAWINNAAATNLTIGSESAGVGVNNQRKSFNGALDYLAMYDRALTESDIRYLFSVPEPSRCLLILGAMVPILTLRRRRD